jgi:hypothetical protein
VALTTTEIPSHTHVITAYYNDASHDHGNIPVNNGEFSLPYDGGASTTRVFNVGNTGGSVAH